jgi:hypothetical protein
VALATIANLAALLRREIDEEDTAALAALETASAFVEAYLDHAIELDEDDEIILDGSGTRVLLLPAWPVTDVASVEVDEEELEPDEDYSWSATGELRKLTGLWPATLRSVTVTYSHGYAQVPPAIVGVVASVAARLYDSPIAVKQESIGGYSVTYTGGGATFQAAELIVLDRYRRS